MKVVKVTQTERKILDAIKQAKSKGLKIKDSGWYVKWSDAEQRFVSTNNCCCPLGAVLLASDDMPCNIMDLKDGEDDSDKLSVAASACLDKDYDWCQSFIETFDDPDIYSDADVSSSRAALKVRELEYGESHGITK